MSKLVLSCSGKELITILNEKTTHLAGTDKFSLCEQRVNRVPLELSLHPEDADLKNIAGHQFERRGNVKKKHNKSSFELVQCYELFIKAKNQAIKNAEKKCHSAVAKKEYAQCKGNVVTVVGQAGIGKTTLAKELALKSLKHQKLFDANLVVYLSCRDLDWTKEMNFLQFLTNNSDFVNRIASEHIKPLLTKLAACETLFIICDGLDESIWKQNSQEYPPQNCSIHQNKTTEIFLTHLLDGALLPKAKKLFTSRPQQIPRMHESYRPAFVVNVLGLDEEHQVKICEDICEKEEHRSNRVLDHLKNHPKLKNFCVVPAHCILVMDYLNESFEDEDSYHLELDSLTTIFLATVIRFIKIFYKKDENFKTENLARFAYFTFAHDLIVFQQNHLKQYQISEDLISTFLNTVLRKIRMLGGNVKANLYFSHLLFHEFFAAIWIIFFMDDHEFKQKISSFQEDRYEMVARFTFGLCNASTQDHLEAFAPDENLFLPYNSKKKFLNTLR